VNGVREDREVAGMPPTGGRRGWRVPRIATEAVWVSLGQASAALGALFGVRVLTELLSVADYGKLALALTASGLFQSVVFAGPGNAALRFYSIAQERGELLGLWHGLWFAMRLRLALAVACGAGVLVLLLAYGSWSLAALALPCVLLAVGTSLPGILDSIQNAARHRATVALHQAAGQWLRIGMAAALMLMVGFCPSVALWGFVIASALVLSSQWMFFRRSFPDLAGRPVHSGATRWRSDIEAYGWPFMLWGIPYWIQTSSERWSLEMFSTTDEVGRYSVLSQLGFSPIVMFTTLLVQLVTPVIFSRIGSGLDRIRVDGARRLNAQLLAVAGVAGLSATLAAWLLHEEVFSLFAAPNYASISTLLPIIVLSGALFAMGQIASIPLLGGDSSRLLPAKISVPLLGTAANLFAAYHWGTAGVVWASLFASAVYLIWIVWLSIRFASPVMPSGIVNTIDQSKPHG
jgi:O-antigen/teichoic acid export membrane protein